MFKNKNKFDVNNPDHIRLLGQRMGMLLALPMLHMKGVSMPPALRQLQNFIQMKDGKLQMMSTPDDFPEYLRNLFAEFMTLSIFDRGYENIFDMRPLTGEDGYDVFSTENNIQFNKILEGDKITYYGSAGARYRVYIDFYGGGHGVDRRLILTKNFYQIRKDLLALRNAGYLKMAQVAYGLVEAIGAGINLAWQAHPDGVATGTSGYQVGRDWATIRKARETLITNNKDKIDYWPQGINGTQLGILLPYQLEERIDRALKWVPENNMAGGNTMGGGFMPTSTTLLAVSTVYYVFIPKAKTTGAVLLDFTQYSSFNKDNLTEEVADWVAFGFDVGDTSQFVRCATAT